MLMLTDDKRRKEMEEYGLDWAARFDWDKAADEFLDLCLNVAGEQ